MNSAELSSTQLSVVEQGLATASENSHCKQSEPQRDSVRTPIAADYTPIPSNLETDKGEEKKMGVLAKLILGQSISEAELKEVSSEILMQERIIATLQKDNEVLRGKHKDLSLKNIELTNYIANLEAKHSLLVSNVESEAQINQKRVDDIQRLTATVNELKRRCEEAESSKMELRARLNSIKSRSVEDKSTFTEVSIVNKTSSTEDLSLGDMNSKHVSWMKGDTNAHKMVSEDRHKIAKNCEPRRSQPNVSNLRSPSQDRQTSRVSMTSHDSKRSEESRLLKIKDSRIRQLEDALMEKERYMVSALQRLKDESDALCLQYKEKISRLELQLKDKEQDEGARKNIPPDSHSIDPETVILKERLSKCEKLLSDNHRFTDLLNRQWERCVEDMKKSHTEQLRLIHKNHEDEIARLQSTQQLELDRILKMKYINDDIKFLNHKLIKMAGNSKSENFLLAVLDRLNYLEKQCKQREEGLAFEISESKRVAEVERRLLAEKMTLIIEQKNQQIKRFQIELDDLLAHIKSLADPKNLFSAQVIF